MGNFFQPLSCPNNCNLLLFSLKNGKKKCIFIQKWLDHLPLMMSYLATISHQTFANMCLRDIPTATKHGRGRYLGVHGGGGGRAWIGWLASLGSFELEIKEGNKTFTEAILSRIVPTSICQVSPLSPPPKKKSWICHCIKHLECNQAKEC